MFYTIKKVTRSQIDAIKRIEIEAGLSRWTEAHYVEEIERFDSLFFVVMTNNTAIGFILARLIMTNIGGSLVENEIEIYNIAVKSEFRHKYIGNALLERLLESASEKQVQKIFLEVRKSNTRALGFYRKNGFEMIGERRDFYTNPTEDALLMCRQMSY